MAPWIRVGTACGLWWRSLRHRLRLLALTWFLLFTWPISAFNLLSFSHLLGLLVLDFLGLFLCS